MHGFASMETHRDKQKDKALDQHIVSLILFCYSKNDTLKSPVCMFGLYEGVLHNVLSSTD